MVSSWSKVNYVDHTLTDQSSLLCFIEDNWGLDYIDGLAVRDAANGRRRPNFKVAPEKQSFDVITGSFDTMFDDEIHLHRFILDPVTGSPIKDERGGY
jgi:phospholipase C